MRGFTNLGIGRAVRRGPSRAGSDLRSAMAFEMVAQIEDEHRRWRDAGGVHPADISSNRRILELRTMPGVDKALAALGGRF